MTDASKMKKKDEFESWWHALKFQECPITLEALSTLPYPPFSLKSGETECYFDGLALASYIVSRGVFQNPLTRQDLTMEDCRRLDDYLDSYCYKYQRQTRKVSVAEAFALRSSVQVQQQGSSDRQTQSRAQVLRNTATAALAGLFVYGNNRPSYNEDSRGQVMANTPSISNEDQMMLDWGFDLSRQFDDSSEYATEGWTVIDDDEALVMATRREAYQTTQASFPRLGGDSNAAESKAGALKDEYIVEKIRSIAIEDEQKEALRARRLELARQRLLGEALRRREQRREESRPEHLEQYKKQKEDEEETQRARAEIEAWREEQWEKLRKISDAKLAEEKQKAQQTIQSSKQSSPTSEEKPESEIVAKVETTSPTEEELEAQKKAKAAAKRKRAKARKKAQKVEERVALEQKKKKEELAAKKSAATLQCAACGQGILDSGFEKFGKKFCSTKCARSAAANR